jgi:pimeloyl-ACP methyl ester carboxylesterase
LIGRRHVIFMHGYDPDGPEKYFGLFRHVVTRANALWQTKTELGDLAIESRDVASWMAATAGPNWQVFTRYHLIRYDESVKTLLAGPVIRQIIRALRWIFDDLFSGTSWRMFRACWRFGIVNAVVQWLFLLWLGFSIAAGALVFVAAQAWLPALHWSLDLGLAAAAAVVTFVALRSIADYLFVIRYCNSFPYFREFGRGEPTALDRPVEAGVARLKALVQANDADEIVVVGHCSGAQLAVELVARALQADAELGRRGPRIVLLTVASIAPTVAFHPSATRMRESIRRIATEPSMTWVDCQSRTDPIHISNFDPAADIAVDADPRRCNPLVWQLRFRDMLPADALRAIRTRLFRLHFQFIMANQLRAPYDYFMMVCGPVPVAEWARRQGHVLAQFSPEGRFLENARLGVLSEGPA